MPIKQLQSICQLSTHRHLLVLKLAKELFTKEELAASNVNGVRGRSALDPAKIAFIKGKFENAGETSF